MLEKGHNEFGIFADDFYISRAFNGDSLVMIAAFVEANYDLIFKVVSNGKLTFATISLSIHIAFYEFI